MCGPYSLIQIQSTRNSFSIVINYEFFIKLRQMKIISIRHHDDQPDTKMVWFRPFWYFLTKNYGLWYVNDPNRWKTLW